MDVLSIWEREPSAHMSHWINDDPLSMGTPSPFFNGLIATPLDSPDGRGGMRQPRGYGAMHDVHADDLDDDFGSDGDDFSDGGRRGRGGYDDLDDEEEDGDIEMSERDDPFEEEPGFVYGPLQTQFGYHLIYLHSCREPSGTGTLNAVRSRWPSP